MAASKRHIRVIPFTDIVVLARLTGKKEEEAIAILGKNRKFHQSLIKKYHGQWLKEMGDRILGSFKVNSDAVYCAGEFVKTCYHENITIRRN